MRTRSEGRSKRIDNQGLLIRIGKREKHILKVIEKNNGIILSKVLKIFKDDYSQAKIKSVIYELENKQRLKVINNKIYLTDIEPARLCNQAAILDIYEQIENECLFSQVPGGLLMISNFLFFQKLKQELKRNKSLIDLKAAKPIRYYQIVTGLTEQLNFKTSELKNRIWAWSNGRYELLINGKMIAMVAAGSHEPIILNRADIENKKTKFRELRELAECIFILKRGLKELNETVLHIGYLDYKGIS